MNELSRMHVLKSLEKLINDEFLMDFFKDSSPNDNMKICIFSVLPVSMKSKTR